MEKNYDMKFIAIAISVTLLMLFIFVCTGCKKIKEDTRRFPVEKNHNDIPCICIFVDSMFVNPSRPPEVIIAVWADGTVIYSKDRIGGTKPYYQKTISPAKIEAFFAVLKGKGLLMKKILKCIGGLIRHLHVYT